MFNGIYVIFPEYPTADSVTKRIMNQPHSYSVIYRSQDAPLAFTLTFKLFDLFFAEELSLKPVTNWVIADLSIKEGRALVMAALKQMVTMSVCNNRLEVASLGPGSADYLSAQFARRYFFPPMRGLGPFLESPDN